MQVSAQHCQTLISSPDGDMSQLTMLSCCASKLHPTMACQIVALKALQTFSTNHSPGAAAILRGQSPALLRTSKLTERLLGGRSLGLEGLILFQNYR